MQEGKNPTNNLQDYTDKKKADANEEQEPNNNDDEGKEMEENGNDGEGEKRNPEIRLMKTKL